jgi:hypothetical protein
MRTAGSETRLPSAAEFAAAAAGRCQASQLKTRRSVTRSARTVRLALETQPGRLTAERDSVPAVLAVGDRIPEATVFAGPREPVTLTDLVQEGPVLLVFYLFDWSST